MTKLEIAKVDFEADIFTLNLQNLFTPDMVYGAFEKFLKATGHANPLIQWGLEVD